MEYCNNFYSLAIVKSLTKLYNERNKRDSKAYWFAPTVYFFKSKTTVLAIQWFFNTYFFLLFRKRVIICMVLSIVIKTIVIISNLLIQITPNLFRLEQTTVVAIQWFFPCLFLIIKNKDNDLF